MRATTLTPSSPRPAASTGPLRLVHQATASVRAPVSCHVGRRHTARGRQAEHACRAEPHSSVGGGGTATRDDHEIVTARANISRPRSCVFASRSTHFSYRIKRATSNRQTSSFPLQISIPAMVHSRGTCRVARHSAGALLKGCVVVTMRTPPSAESSIVTSSRLPVFDWMWSGLLSGHELDREAASRHRFLDRVST